MYIVIYAANVNSKKQINTLNNVVDLINPINAIRIKKIIDSNALKLSILH
jgi:hypothetical protein